MASQYNYQNYFPQGPEFKPFPQPEMMFPPGSVTMDRVSNTSSNSYSSTFSGETFFSVPASPATTMPYGPGSPGMYEVDSNALTPQQYDSTLDATYSSQYDSQRHTPSSLEWTRNSELLTLYTFKVPKGKEPYFELLESYRATWQTPVKVYLDQPKHHKKNAYPCQYPGTCNGKQNVFGRPADLERHYKNVHAPVEQKDSFPCDYLRCARAQDPFTRKDHFRDHLRDYHKEDIGCAKGEKKMDKKKWQQAQNKWLDERLISHKHWRCGRCLVKNFVSQVGWDCSLCRGTCEEDRVRVRERLVTEGGSMGGVEETPRYGALATVSYQMCNTCNGEGSTWVQESYGGGSWLACPNCQPASENSSQYVYENTVMY